MNFLLQLIIMRRVFNLHFSFHPTLFFSMNVKGKSEQSNGLVCMKINNFKIVN